MMKHLQKLGSALMLPVAVLPICGILMGLGYAIAPAVMGAAGATEGFAYVLGFFLIKAGAAVIDNMALLFVIGTAVGLAKENNGTAALAGLVSWLVFTTLLAPAVVNTIIPSMIPEVEEITASVKDGVAVLNDPAMVMDTTSTNYIAFSKIANPFIGILAGIIGALCYNKFKDTKLPDVLSFFSGKRSVAIITVVVSIVVSAILLFVWPVIFTVLVKVGKAIVGMGAVGVVGSAAICAFICGVTEPFEFAFMFLAFPLYIVYSLLYGIFTTITVALGFRAGFCFSAGATDLLFGAALPAANNYWVILPMGIAAFVVFYFVFRFAITKWDLKTPGREDDQEGELKIELANNDFTAMAEIILEGVGGKENVVSIDHCITRLRLEVKDRLQVDEAKIRSSGAAGVIRPGKTSVQVVIGPKVQFVYDEFKKLAK